MTQKVLFFCLYLDKIDKLRDSIIDPYGFNNFDADSLIDLIYLCLGPSTSFYFKSSAFSQLLFAQPDVDDDEWLQTPSISYLESHSPLLSIVEQILVFVLQLINYAAEKNNSSIKNSFLIDKLALSRLDLPLFMILSSSSSSTLSAGPLKRALLVVDVLLALLLNSSESFQYINGSVKSYDDGVTNGSFFGPLITLLNNPADEIVLETLKV